MRHGLAAAAALPQLPRWQYLGFFAGALAVQFTWGLTAVATRYVQTRAPLPVPTLQLWVVASVIAWVGLLLLYSIPSAVHQQWLKHKTARQQAATAATIAGSPGPAPDCGAAADAQNHQQAVNDTAGGTSVPTPSSAAQTQQQTQAQQQQGRWHRVEGAAKVAALSIFIGTLLNMSAVGNAGAAKLVNAYVVQLLLLLMPLVCALCNMLVLRQPSPPQLLPAVLLSLAGGGMVVGGYWMQAQQAAHKEPVAVRVKDVVLAVFVALLAMVGQALYFVMVQLTRSSLTAQQVLWGNRNVAFVVVLPLALAVDGTSWQWVPALGAPDWGAIVFIGIGVQTVGAMGMQWTTRAIGAAAVSSVSSLRLVASIAGSVVVLHETPRHPLVWSGFVLVVLTMAAYTAFLYKCQKAPPTADSSQKLPAGASSSSSSRLPPTATDVPHQVHSCQEDARRAVLLQSAGSDASWQLFTVLLDHHRSGRGVTGRSKSVPVLGQQQYMPHIGVSGRDLEAQRQQSSPDVRQLRTHASTDVGCNKAPC